MTKYDESFKLSIVQSYAAGHSGFNGIARRYGLDAATVRRWVKGYELHGVDGLRKKFSHYSAAFKLSVLQRMWQEELSIRQALALFDIRGGTGVIREWERQYHDGGIQALEPKPRGRMKKMPAPESAEPLAGQSEGTRTLEQLLKENEYLRAELAYLKKLQALLQAKKPLAPTKRGSSLS